MIRAVESAQEPHPYSCFRESQKKPLVVKQIKITNNTFLLQSRQLFLLLDKKEKKTFYIGTETKIWLILKYCEIKDHFSIFEMLTQVMIIVKIFFCFFN